MHSAPLPLDWYTGPDAFAQERRVLFATAWQMIGRVDQLTASGAYVCGNLAGWPVFALRDQAGTIGAFRNACRHRGMQVANDSGCTRAFVCHDGTP